MEYTITVLKSGCVSSFSMDQLELAKDYMFDLAQNKIAFKFEALGL